MTNVAETVVEGTQYRPSLVRRAHQAGATALVLLVVLVFVIGLYDSSFWRVSNIYSLLEQAAPLVLLAIGQSLVVMTGRIDLANAGLASLSGVVLSQLLGDFGLAAVVITLVLSAAAGALSGAIQAITQVPSFIITLGFLGIYAGVALTLADADTILVTDGYSAVEWIFLRIFGFPISFALVLVVAALIMVAMAVTPFGRRIRAAGYNERAAALSGIRVNRLVVTVFAVSGACAGLAAVFQVSQLQSAGATTSDSLLLPSIAAVLIGGTAIAGGVGGVGRTILGGLIIAVLRVGLDVVGISSAYQPILYGAIVIITIGATVDRSRGAVVA